MPDYKNIKFLESTNNLREILGSNSKREISLELANQVSVCLEQGRLLFEAAQEGTWEIKPLLVYSGMVGFSKAIIMARNMSKLETLPQRHGLTDISSSPLLEALEAKVEKDGTFQRLNDSCSDLEKLIVHKKDRKKEMIAKPTCKSNHLVETKIKLKDVLARIPELEDLYSLTFKEESCVVDCSHFSEEPEGVFNFDVLDFQPFTDLPSLERTVSSLRERFKFLAGWRVIHASRTSSIQFASLERDEKSEFSPEILEKSSGGFSLPYSFDTTEGRFTRHLPKTSINFTLGEFRDRCQPIRGNLTPSPESTYLIESFQGLHLSEISLYYIGMFLLCSLVRYRPSLWANAIARRATSTERADDHALAVIEEFVDLSLTVVPDAVFVAINEPFS